MILTLSRFRSIALGAILALVAAPAVAQVAADLDFREFTGANGAKIKAVLVDKSESDLTLLLPNGARTVIAYDKLSDADQEYARSWNKEKAVFLQQCQSLTLLQVLELRGYESFKFSLDNNQIYIKGELNGHPAKYRISTGSRTSYLHLPSAEAAECEVGPADEVMRFLTGEVPAAWTGVKELRLGESILKDQRLLAADLQIEGSAKPADAVFGADFLSKLSAVISYKENRIFLRPDLAAEEDGDTIPTVAEQPDFRIFKMADGKTHQGNVINKTAAAVKLKLSNGKDLTLSISRLTEEDKQFVSDWTEESAAFLRHCRGLSIEDLFLLRRFQSFEYDRINNGMFVDGELNGLETAFEISTGSSTSLLDINVARQAKCEVGPMDLKIVGPGGGEAMAAVCKVPVIRIGDAEITNRSIQAMDMFPDEPEGGDYGAIFGADFLRELNGIITYQEERIFLRQE